MSSRPTTFAWPIRFTQSGQFAAVEQGSAGEKAQRLDMIRSTPTGSARATPEFGRPELAFAQGPVGAEQRRLALIAALREHSSGVDGWSVVRDGDDWTVDVRGVADDTPAMGDAA
jgi:hypothetical protein